VNPDRSNPHFSYPLSVAIFNHSKPQRTLRSLISDIKFGKVISPEEIKGVGDSYSYTSGKVLLACALSGEKRLQEFAVQVFQSTNDPFILNFLNDKFKKALARKSQNPVTFERFLHFLESIPISQSRNALWQLVECKDSSSIEKSKGIKAQYGRIDESKFKNAKAVYGSLFFDTGLYPNDALVRARTSIMEGLQGVSLPLAFLEMMDAIESGISYSHKQITGGAYTYNPALQKQLYGGEVTYRGFAIDDIGVALKGSITDGIRAQKIVKLFETVEEIVKTLEASREKSAHPHHLECEHGRQLKRGYLILNLLFNAMSETTQPIVNEYLEKLIGDQGHVIYWVGLQGASSPEAATENEYVISKAACCDVTGYVRWRSAYALSK